MIVSEVGDEVCRIFSKRFSGVIFRGKPKTYLLKLQFTGLRNIGGGISHFGAAGDVFPMTGLKNEVMRVWYGGSLTWNMR